MARKASIPDEIMRHKPCNCCRIRDDGGVYRVYKYGALKLRNGSWSSDWGYLIGKIIPGEGFMPNKRYLRELEERHQFDFSDGITDVAYGQYALLMFLSGDVIEKLGVCFPAKKAKQIYSYALILCANGFICVDLIDDFYQESVLALKFADYSIEMDHNALLSLLYDLGNNTDATKMFEHAMTGGVSEDTTGDCYTQLICVPGNDFAGKEYNRWGIGNYDNLIMNDKRLIDTRIQDNSARRGFDFILFVTGVIRTRIEGAVRGLHDPGISSYGLLVKAGHMRMVLEDDKWKLCNTRKKDLELLKGIGFVPEAVLKV